MEKKLFTSESVSEGHPDKIADQVSDAILDAFIAKDKHVRVACEVYVKKDIVIVGGEISTDAYIDIEKVTRKVVQETGYTYSDIEFNSNSFLMLTAISKQSPDISRGINKLVPSEQGAGDQGLVFGYATRETKSLMPAPILYAHRLVERQAEVRKSGLLPWLRPDAKSQVTLQYVDKKVSAIDSVILSTQHDNSIDTVSLKEGVMEEIIKKSLPKHLLSKSTKFFINPTGHFVVGGPIGDCGLTGRKIIVDTYGGMARHGGGSFSGKDPSKVDRSGAYAARYVAKNIVSAGLADRCEIQISYAIGIAEPISIFIETFGTGKVPDSKLTMLVREFFDLRPYGIIKMLNLLRPIYKQTATYGHFGRNIFPWEETDKAILLREAAF